MDVKKVTILNENGKKCRTEPCRSDANSICIRMVNGVFHSLSLNKKAYISANSTRYKARFKREGVMYGKSKEKIA